MGEEPWRIPRTIPYSQFISCCLCAHMWQISDRCYLQWVIDILKWMRTTRGQPQHRFSCPDQGRLEIFITQIGKTKLLARCPTVCCAESRDSATCRELIGNDPAHFSQLGRIRRTSDCTQRDDLVDRHMGALVKSKIRRSTCTKACGVRLDDRRPDENIDRGL
jgi:hypothetical protein